MEKLILRVTLSDPEAIALIKKMALETNTVPATIAKQILVKNLKTQK